MNQYGFIRVTAAVPKTSVANVERNLAQHLQLINAHPDSDLIVFPELSLTGYTCGDLFAQRALIDAALSALDQLTQHVRKAASLVIVGLPIHVEEAGGLYNCAAVLSPDGLLGIVPKTYLPNYREFYESRWFVGA